jgi:hypothetical protein
MADGRPEEKIDSFAILVLLAQGFYRSFARDSPRCTLDRGKEKIDSFPISGVLLAQGFYEASSSDVSRSSGDSEPGFGFQGFSLPFLSELLEFAGSGSQKLPWRFFRSDRRAANRGSEIRPYTPGASGKSTAILRAQPVLLFKDSSFRFVIRGSGTPQRACCEGNSHIRRC